MRTSSIAAALAGLSLVHAAPMSKRNNGGGGGIDDVAILNYALTLEHLEATFYAEGLAKYSASDFTDAGLDESVRARISEIAGHEATHVSFLTTALQGVGATPVKACKYSFPYTDPKSFLAVASILEGVGVSAYLGAAASIMEKAYLTAAGAILTVESRHSAYIRNVVSNDPFPSAFDTPLGFNQVYSLAAPFFVSCPEDNPALPVKAFPALAATPEGDSVPEGQVKVSPADPSVVEGKGQLYAAFIGLTGTQFGVWNPETMTVQIPYNAAGQTYVVLTTSNEAVTDDNTVAGPAVFDVAA